MSNADEVLPAGVDRLPSGKYRWRARVDGRNRSGTAPTISAAVGELWAAKAGGDAPDAANVPTVAALVEAWTAQADRTPNTAASHAGGWRHVPAEFRDLPADRVTPARVWALWQTLAHISPHTLRRAGDLMSRSFRWAVRLGLVESNPFTGDVRPQVARSKRIVPPTVAEVAALAGALDAAASPMFAWVRFAATTGARPGEVCALNVARIAGGGCTVRIGSSIDRFGNVTEGKNGPNGHRTVELDDRTAAAIGTLAARAGADGWLWTSERGGTLRPDVARERICRVAGVEWTRRLYDLRHFAASQAFAAGATYVEVAEMLGDNPATVLRTYAHIVESSTAASARVAAALDAG